MRTDCESSLERAKGIKVENWIAIEAAGLFSAKASGNFAIVTLAAIVLGMLLARFHRRQRW